MTREEAKEILTHNWTRVDNPNYSESELDEAFFMAIEALTNVQNLHNGDIISRQGAIATVEELNKKVNDGRVSDTICTSDVLRRLKSLPSAEQKKGHWIDDETNYTCSECYRGCWVNSDYCPWCGADMRGEEA